MVILFIILAAFMVWLSFAVLAKDSVFAGKDAGVFKVPANVHSLNVSLVGGGSGGAGVYGYKALYISFDKDGVPVNQDGFHICKACVEQEFSPREQRDMGISDDKIEYPICDPRSPDFIANAWQPEYGI